MTFGNPRSNKAELIKTNKDELIKNNNSSKLNNKNYLSNISNESHRIKTRSITNKTELSKPSIKSSTKESNLNDNKDMAHHRLHSLLKRQTNFNSVSSPQPKSDPTSQVFNCSVEQDELNFQSANPSQTSDILSVSNVPVFNPFEEDIILNFEDKSKKYKDKDKNHTSINKEDNELKRRRNKLQENKDSNLNQSENSPVKVIKNVQDKI